MWARARHPNVAQLLGFGASDGRLLVQMELAALGSLDSFLDCFGPMQAAHIVTAARDVLDGLDYLHTLEPAIVHGNLRGASVLIQTGSRMQLSDVGLFELRGERIGACEDLKRLAWTAPEVVIASVSAAKKGALLGGRPRAPETTQDMWSFGCLIIEMSTAKRPWVELPLAAVQAALRRSLAPAVPEELPRLAQDPVRRCLSRRTSGRPTAQELKGHRLWALEAEG